MSGVNISVPVLSGSNFNNWKFRIRSLLEKEQIESVLNEDLPTDVTQRKDFLIKDAKAKAIIIQGVADKHLDIIKDASTAKEMVNALQSIFVRSSAFSKLTLWRKLMHLKCNHRDNLEDHFLKFDTIIRELEELGSKINESDKICHLLLSLSKEYDTVITALETQPDIKIDFVKARLLDEEIKLKSKSSSNLRTDSEVSFKASCSNSTANRCYNCGDKNHYIAQCPNKTISRGRRRGVRGSFRGRSYKYKSRGEFASFAENSSEITFVASKENIGLSCNDVFIIDSGASEHMVKEDLMNEMFDVKLLDHKITIYIANGEKMEAFNKGKLKISCQNKIITVEALIVSGLKHNLLALSKLVSKNFRIIFNKNHMSICGYDFKINCDFVKGLYVLKANILKNAENCYVSRPLEENIWHRRLGHLNYEGLRQLAF